MKKIRYNELNEDNLSAIDTKAKSKNDGIYTLRGIDYRVRNNRVTHYRCNGEVLHNFGNFHVSLGYAKDLKSVKE